MLGFEGNMKDKQADGKDVFFMTKALVQAGRASELGEVPVGALVVRDGLILARAYNKKESWHDPTAHAEILALRKAAKKLQSWRLDGCQLYVTLEPCVMCMGALVQARIGRVVYGATDPKAGGCGSLYDLSSDNRLNHSFQVTRGLLAQEAGDLLRDFFKTLRKNR